MICSASVVVEGTRQIEGTGEGVVNWKRSV